MACPRWRRTCIRYLLLRNKLSQTLQLRATNLHYFIVSVGQEFRYRLARSLLIGSSWLQSGFSQGWVSPEALTGGASAPKFAYLIVSRTQFPEGRHPEGFQSLLTVGRKPPSVPWHMPFPTLTAHNMEAHSIKADR